MHDPLGDRIKSYEQKAYHDTVKKPIVVRLDGKNFSRLTRLCTKPFDTHFCQVMDDVCVKLLQFTNANIAYTQSDEITLVFFNNVPESEILFGGRIQKLTSVLASKATLEFNKHWSSEGLFDCRTFYVPDVDEAINALIWREQDCTRNSVLSYAMSVFGKKTIHDWNITDCLNALNEQGKPWTDLSTRQKYGFCMKHSWIETKYAPAELSSLPEKHDARTNPDLLVRRRVLSAVDLPIRFLTKGKEVFNANTTTIS